ncbi:hypothetical protein [Thiolapillus sp.]|uniref:hypothetical protein n=1 Tax=Thiolapillus sp. TaxID=2017437 RepID=UPI003AF4BFF0
MDSAILLSFHTVLPRAIFKVKKTTAVIHFPDRQHMLTKLRFLKKLWSINDLQDSGLARFADQQLVGDTRQGLMAPSVRIDVHPIKWNSK